ncbi:hypothetical protein MNV49_007567 [Pseudohyphozyma bogoriensis]|nr:hypothetical protein MNV49_007567 [Pseudohyphozyma bogoriensis]
MFALWRAKNVSSSPTLARSKLNPCHPSHKPKLPPKSKSTSKASTSQGATTSPYLRPRGVSDHFPLAGELSATALRLANRASKVNEWTPETEREKVFGELRNVLSALERWHREEEGKQAKKKRKVGGPVKKLLKVGDA